jgi:hypothetical protein
VAELVAELLEELVAGVEDGEMAPAPQMDSPYGLPERASSV